MSFILRRLVGAVGVDTVVGGPRERDRGLYAAVRRVRA